MVADGATGALTRTASTTTVGHETTHGSYIFKNRNCGSELRLSTGLVLLRTRLPELRSLLMIKSASMVMSWWKVMRSSAAPAMSARRTSVRVRRFSRAQLAARLGGVAVDARRLGSGGGSLGGGITSLSRNRDGILLGLIVILILRLMESLIPSSTRTSCWFSKMTCSQACIRNLASSPGVPLHLIQLMFL